MSIMINTSPGTGVEKIRQAYNFEIDKFRLYGPDNLSTPHYGLFRSDTGECVGDTFSSQYVPHKTQDIITITEAASQAFDSDVDVTCGFRDGHYVSISPTRDFRRSVYGTEDNVFPRFLLKAGYNGRAFQVSMGFYRDLCRNMAMLSSVKESRISIRHSSDFADRMQELVASLTQLAESWKVVTETITRMDSIQVHMAEFLSRVYPAKSGVSKAAEKRHLDKISRIVRRLEHERRTAGRDETGPVTTGWQAYNAVQGYVQHDKARHGGRYIAEFDRMILASRDSEVKTAEQILLAA